MKHFIKTDDLQWRAMFSDSSFYLVEVREHPNGYIFVSGVIDLEDYTDSEIESYVTAYYNSLNELKDTYKDDAPGIIAECIFEQTSEMELTCFGPFGDENIAEQEMDTYIQKQEVYFDNK